MEALRIMEVIDRRINADWSMIRCEQYQQQEIVLVKMCWDIDPSR